MPCISVIARNKWHIAVDTDGRLTDVNLTPADISDSVGGQQILDGLRKRRPWMKHLFDSGYDRTVLIDKTALLDYTIEVARPADRRRARLQSAAPALGGRTDLRLETRWRPLVRDDEGRMDVSKGMIQLAMTSLLLRRTCH